MKFSTAAITAVLSATAFAAPAPAADVSMMVAAAPQWTIQNMTRTCGGGTCNWSFGIYPGSGASTACKFAVHGSPATQTNSNGNVCGAYTVSTGWSGQFGAGNGFTTLAVVNNAQKQIIYPSYTDTQLNTEHPVKPDQSYAPQNLPS